jgi:hypothetical protein
MKTFKHWLAFALSTLVLDASAALTVWGPPNSVAVGAHVDFFETWFQDEWTPIAGVAYRYEVDPSCGAFEGGLASFDGVTTEWGAAAAPAFYGLSVTLSCRTLLFLDGYPGPFDVSVHVFSPDAVAMTVVPLVTDPVVNEQYLVEVLLTESGLPVNAFPTSGTIGTSASGSSGTLMYARTAINSGRAVFGILANDKQGHYDITIGYRDRQVVIPIDQRVRPSRN